MLRSSGSIGTPALDARADSGLEFLPTLFLLSEDLLSPMREERDTWCTTIT